MSMTAEVSLREIASLLARGYLRLIVARTAETGPIAPRPEPAVGSPNLLDSSTRAKHELDRGVRP